MPAGHHMPESACIGTAFDFETPPGWAGEYKRPIAQRKPPIVR